MHGDGVSIMNVLKCPCKQISSSDFKKGKIHVLEKMNKTTKLRVLPVVGKVN